MTASQPGDQKDSMGDATEPRERLAWQIVLPTIPRSGGPGQPVNELRELFRLHRTSMVDCGVYSQEEMAAQGTGAEISWAAAPAEMAGPRTTVARVEDKAIAGVELWHQRRDRFWFLEGLIRDPAPEFKGVGAEVVRAAVDWWVKYFGDSGEDLRVHSIKREKGAVDWWTRYIGRPPDFTDAFIRSGPHNFPAVGWILHVG